MQFKIGFEKEDKETLYSYFDDIIASERWSWPGSKYEVMFEELFAEYVGTKYAVSFSSWWGAALAVLNYIKKNDSDWKNVLCPSNTFMATPMSVKEVGLELAFVDCNREDLCMSYDHLDSIYDSYDYNKTVYSIVFLVHIGGHIAFDVEKICKRATIVIEDCAHAVGAQYKDKKAGTFGKAGIYSFHATKTITTGEGGMVVTSDKKLAKYCRRFRDYGKFDYKINGGNYRMSEFTAALGVVQTKRIDDIVNWKREYVREYLDNYYRSVIFPEGMKSGYYKYITFDKIDNSCGKVYDNPCHKIMKTGDYLPNTDWVANNHWCWPLYYKGE